MKYICVEGNIGSGKTSLVNALCKDLEAVPLLEQFEENPFLSLFYEEPQKYAYAVEISFLLDRYRQLDYFFKKQLAENENQIIIGDYFIQKCLIFAQINLTEYDYQLFKDNFDRLFQEMKSPDLIIYLDMDIGAVKQNIQSRGRSYEQDIAYSYLEQVNKGYSKHLLNNTNWNAKTKHFILTNNEAATYDQVLRKSIEIVRNL
jgi:deoxyguanosine kinase